MHQRTPGLAIAYFFLRCHHRARWYLVQHGGEGAQKTVFVKRVRPPDVAITPQQVEREQEGTLNKAEFRVAIAIAPIELFDIGSKQFGINGCKTMPGQQLPAVTTENETSLVLTDQACQFGNQTGDVQIGKIILLVDAAVARALLIGFIAPVGQGGLTAELTWQVTLGRRLQSLFTDSLHQQVEKAQ